MTHSKPRRQIQHHGHKLYLPSALEALNLSGDELEDIVALIPEGVTLAETMLPIPKVATRFGALESVSGFPDHYSPNIKKNKWYLPQHRELRTEVSPKPRIKQKPSLENQVSIAKELLAVAEENLQCGICFCRLLDQRQGALLVRHCLHAFCEKCISKWMLSGKNQCPMCRTHLASRRDLRASPLISILKRIITSLEDIQKHEASAASESPNRVSASSLAESQRSRLAALLRDISTNSRASTKSSVQRSLSLKGMGKGDMTPEDVRSLLYVPCDLDDHPYPFPTVFVKFTLDPSDSRLDEATFHRAMHQGPSIVHPVSSGCYEIESTLELSGLGMYCASRLDLDGPLFFSVPGVLSLTKLYMASRESSHFDEILSKLMNHNSPLDPGITLGDTVQDLLALGSCQSSEPGLSELGVSLCPLLGQRPDVPLIIHARRSPFCTSGLTSDMVANLPPFVPKVLDEEEVLKEIR